MFLETTMDDPELPVAEVNVRDSILATTSQGAPLLRVDGQGDLETMRDAIVWEGLRIGYHEISVYRRDQSSQVGSVPILFDRPSWTVAVGIREMNSVHGDLGLDRIRGGSRSPWTFKRDDAEVDPESRASSSGAVLARIPSPS